VSSYSQWLPTSKVYSLIRTFGVFHNLFNTRLYHLAVAADDVVREGIVRWVLEKYRVASLTLLLDNGLSAHQEVPQQLDVEYASLISGISIARHSNEICSCPTSSDLSLSLKLYVVPH
jgi:hypothetical protein